MAKVEK